jgi:hypothetical protein
MAKEIQSRHSSSKDCPKQIISLLDEENIKDELVYPIKFKKEIDTTAASPKIALPNHGKLRIVVSSLRLNLSNPIVNQTIEKIQQFFISLYLLDMPGELLESNSIITGPSSEYSVGFDQGTVNLNSIHI